MRNTVSVTERRTKYTWTRINKKGRHKQEGAEGGGKWTLGKSTMKAKENCGAHNKFIVS